jgi:4-hydroxybenzoate polyprenyltransferase
MKNSVFHSYFARELYSKENHLSIVFWIFKALRPTQWIKNGFILIPLLFAKKVFEYDSFLRSISAVAAFCLLVGGIYLINDIVDLESDRRHPVKRYRPVAAGHISPWFARLTACLLIFSSLLWAAHLGRGFLLAVLIYLSIQLLYTYGLKGVVILDIFCIAAGFFLRVVAGALAINVVISHWLIICSVLISMFLALAKRRHELMSLGEIEAANHRKVLGKYSLYLLDQMIVVITACTLLSYMLYCFSSETIEKFGTDHMIFSSPFVLFGIFRYLYLVHKENKGGAPEKVLISDRPLQVSVVLWGLTCILIIYNLI